MLIVDKRPIPPQKEFGELPLGAVFSLLENDAIFVKIYSADVDENTFGLEDNSLFYTSPSDLVIELKAHLVVEG